MNNASLASWLQRLETLHPSAMDLGLERVSQVANSLGLLPPAAEIVTVAGTNGKGSTVATLEALLRSAGRRTGCFTSPHFLRFNERIRVDGAEATDAEIVAAFEAIEQARGDVSLTYFEFAALAALLVFRQHQLDTLVLEVGLGGRLDAVNMVDADVTVITSIDLDHQEWLGDDRELIAREKAGILRRGAPAVIADPEPPASLAACIEESGALPLWLGRDFRVLEAGEGRWQAQVISEGRERTLPALADGPILPANISAALQATLALGVEITDQSAVAALADMGPVTGRRQAMEVAGRHYLLDVAHNPAAINGLLEYMGVNPCNGRNIALFSAMEDKDVGDIVQRSAGFFDAWFLAEQPDNPRAIGAEQVAALLREQGQGMISVSKNLRQAFRRAQTLLGEQDRLVVFGSFFTVAAVLPLLDKDRRKERTC